MMCINLNFGNKGPSMTKIKKIIFIKILLIGITNLSIKNTLKIPHNFCENKINRF